ncbi:MAG: hypothetical protein KF678_10155 [Phycisphaeraceae bacterium]|nr:hypothetical protein [Phycisphaeraceae bacterium]
MREFVLTISSAAFLLAVAACQTGTPNEMMGRPVGETAQCVDADAAGNGWMAFPSEQCEDTPAPRVEIQALSRVKPRHSAAALAVEAIARAQFEVNDPDLPARDDLLVVLKTVVHALATPDFDSYHRFMSDRGCELITIVAAQADELRGHMDFGYTGTQWEKLSLEDKTRAYWLAVDQRKSRWLSVDNGSVIATTNGRQLPKAEAGMVSSQCTYKCPGSECMSERVNHREAAVAFVHMRVTGPLGEAPVVLCFVYSETEGRWYPWTAMVFHGESGPVINVRI